MFIMIKLLIKIGVLNVQRCNINIYENTSKYDNLKIRNTITKENIDKIYNIYKYEYTNYYKLA